MDGEEEMEEGLNKRVKSEKVRREKDRGKGIGRERRKGEEMGDERKE